MQKKQVVVVGGGAGGLELVRRLSARLSDACEVTLVERNRTHIWKPLLHEVAAGSLDANLDEVGYRNHAWRWGYKYFYGSLESVDRAAREVVTAPIHDEDGTEIIGRHRIRYDVLVLAVGAISNDFGTPGVRAHCMFLEDRVQADRFRQRLLNHCLRVSRTLAENPAAETQVRIAIVGGGATGVELAAELFNAAQALKHYGLESFDEKRLKVTLVEAGPRILPQLPETLAQAAREELEGLGVRVLTGTQVVAVDGSGMQFASGERLEAELRVWAAGVRGADLLRGIGGLETNRNNQLVVRPTLQTTLDDAIFAIGDCCACTDRLAEKPRQVPPRAQAAHQMAATVYANIRAMLKGGAMEEFVYRDRGSLVSLSRFSTVGSLMGNLVGGRMAIEGRLARFVYLSLYRMHLIAIHGWLRGIGLMAVGRVNQVIRPRLKLH